MFFNKSKKLLIEKERELQIALAEISLLKSDLQHSKNLFDTSQAELASCNNTVRSYIARFSQIIDKEKFLNDLEENISHKQQELEDLNNKYKSGLLIYSELEKHVELYRETLDITEYGLFEPKFNLDASDLYKIALDTIYQQQKQLIKDGTAINCFTEWEVSGSKVEGRKMTKRYSKLMLYAFNGECDALIANVKWNNVSKIELRIIETFNSINKLGESHNILINRDFLELKLKELFLTHEYEDKKYQEKEEQRRIREQMREEEKAQKEFERAQRDAEEEENTYKKALERARQDLAFQPHNPHEIEELSNRIKLLEQNLIEAHEKKERAISLAQMTKVGHIYIISNIGSFGDEVYKIGMTRRLDPLDRIRELGDASVPFQFDIHAIIYSENAPQLEYQLHQYFKEKRINKINLRKEFFKVSLNDIEEFILTQTNAEIHFTKLAEAREFRESIIKIQEAFDIKTENHVDNKFPSELIN
ncbi:DUF4041 domain-containing protein [Flavihumibacter sp.]|uniref:DUF4041 domain-containing protein n=1 Tax=Flavihumibacter sp. TaxID=1913981 RepID=UPI002FCA18D5